MKFLVYLWSHVTSECPISPRDRWVTGYRPPLWPATPITMWKCCNTQPPISGTHCSLFSPPYGNTSTHNFPITLAHTQSLQHTHTHIQTFLHLPSSSQLLLIDYRCIELNLTSDLCSLPTVVPLFLHVGLPSGDPAIFKESPNEKGMGWIFGNRCMQITCIIQACVTDKRCIPLQIMLQLYFFLSQFYFCHSLHLFPPETGFHTASMLDCVCRQI